MLFSIWILSTKIIIANSDVTTQSAVRPISLPDNLERDLPRAGAVKFNGKNPLPQSKLKITLYNIQGSRPAN